MKLAGAAMLLCLTAAAPAQWTIQDAHTTADLRGIHAIGNGIAWASGTEGTVLRTTNDGRDWQRCATPPDASHLDFRGIQAFDASTAIVMSSGKGPLSRLYKTTDACHSWKLLFTNPDPEGFWDALRFFDTHFGVLMGDSVRDTLYAVWTSDQGKNWQTFARDQALRMGPRTGMFAASNSALALPPNPAVILGVANNRNQSVLLEADFGELCAEGKNPPRCPKDYTWLAPVHLPIEVKGDSSGVFSISVTDQWDEAAIVAVGGDYRKPDEDGIAMYSDGARDSWDRAQTQPHGFRSAVAYDATTKTWITVGPNGTDISTDDGRNWRPLRPAPTDPPDADQHWNALSLPFVVGPHGRIGKLRSDAIPPHP